MTDLSHLRGADVARNREADHRRAIFQPPEELTGSAWADRYRVISEGNPEPGRWRTGRTPYLREILDTCTDPAVERVIFQKAARVGGTEVVNNLIGYYIDHEPSQILIVQPTVDDGKGWSKEQLEPMLRDTPQLRGKVWQAAGRRDKRDTIQQKMFAGGFIVIVGANSAAGFRRRNIQRVFLEEVDGYPPTTKGRGTTSDGLQTTEGDPVTLAIKRTQNYDDRLIFENSTPTVKGASNIERDYGLSDQRRYYVPCPHCEYMQVLRWRQLRWNADDPSTVWYVCGDIDPETGELTAGCGEMIEEHHKVAMLRGGEWRAERPGRAMVGFHIWAAYSPFTSWPRLVEEWLLAQGSTEKLQVFINTVLGETWEDAGERIDPSELDTRRETYPAEVPAGVGVLTAFVDVQKDRLEIAVKGWGEGQESWIIAHHRLVGDPMKDEVWERLDLLRTKRWMHESGTTITIRSMGVDSGYQAERVYAYVRKRQREGVFASKGVPSRGAPLVRLASRRPNRAGVRVVSINPDAGKDLLFARLRLTMVGPGYMHFRDRFADGLDEAYLEQFGAEQAVIRYVNGVPRRVYEVIGKRANEAIDLEVGCLAALHLQGVAVLDHLATYRDQLITKGRREKVQPPPSDVPDPAPPEPAPSVHRARRRIGQWVNTW